MIEQLKHCKTIEEYKTVLNDIFDTKGCESVLASFQNIDDMLPIVRVNGEFYVNYEGESLLLDDIHPDDILDVVYSD